MDTPAWLLVALTFVVVAYLLPQVVKSRKLMGEARTEDRFSSDMRLLETAGVATSAAEAAIPESASVRIHTQRRGTQMDRPVNRSVRLTQDVKELVSARAARAAAGARRAAAAKRRLALVSIFAGVALALGVSAGIGIVSWGWVAAPIAGVVGVLGLGTVAARQGLANDARLAARVREVEERLARTPSGRLALGGSAAAGEAAGAARRRYINWAKVAEDASENVETTEGGQTDIAQTQPQSAEPPSVQEEERTALGSEEETEGEIKAKADEAQASVGTEWTPVPVPPPTYTLKAPAPLYVPMSVDEDAQGAAEVRARVPMRPMQATPLPATAPAVAVQEVVGTDTGLLDLEEILNKRRAKGA
ncbi:MAG: hypothetical protein Q4G30_06375 [Actinomycetaceae bacterium]|nr:hypothetical protein [Actinomycetaceae bacterium]